MSKAARNILSLNHDEAMDFFMKSEQYHGFELPEYFSFDEVLKYVREKVRTIPYEECLQKGVSPDSLSDVNLDILLNKDGRYAVRPIILANPFLYYFLVREVCCESNWQVIKDLFEKFNVPHITSCAIPVIPNEKEPFHKATTINNWWNSMEQRSIELSLEYRYMFVTDITNCYGSVNPQTFDWAFTLKDTTIETGIQSPIAQNIQKFLRALQQGRNIGIPQGSAIFDFVGEIILGYSDLLLHEAIKKAKRNHKITGSYEIIRYRDDYRIFCNDKDELETISYILQQVLECLNFRMNSQKTKISDSIVTDAIKHDKLAYIYNTPIFNKKGVDFDSFEKHLLYILMFSRQYPDSGSVRTMLSDIDKRIEDHLKSLDEKNISKAEDWETVDLGEDAKPAKAEGVFSELKTYHRSKYIPGGSVRALSAVCTHIALENVGCSHYALRIISRMIDSLKDMDEKRSIIDLVYHKLCNQPNSSYNQLWLQNMTYTQDKKQGTSPYTLRLCQLVAGKVVEPLWNNDWLKAELTTNIPYESIVDGEILKKVTPVITFRETRRYNEIEY
ncbi:MAG: RNA-directed DNA polymerase [Alloprevotella sp.]|nr:RNA-directed DNA polymerase [Bacteroidales bacterium]MDY4568139.1 RNA-directed DNA polymerase [Alloprevotella sp.]